MSLLHCIAFFVTYIGLLMSMENNVITSKNNAMRKTHAENGCGNSALTVKWAKMKVSFKYNRAVIHILLILFFTFFGQVGDPTTLNGWKPLHQRAATPCLRNTGLTKHQASKLFHFNKVRQFLFFRSYSDGSTVDKLEFEIDMTSLEKRD